MVELSPGDAEFDHKLFIFMAPSYNGSQDPPLLKPLLLFLSVFVFDSLEDKRV